MFDIKYRMVDVAWFQPPIESDNKAAAFWTRFVLVSLSDPGGKADVVDFGEASQTSRCGPRNKWRGTWYPSD